MYSLPVSSEHFSYAKLLEEIIRLCRRKRFALKIIGRVKTPAGISYPIYRITINPQQEKIFCLEAGTHGYEIAGPLSVLELLKHPACWLNKNLRYEIYPLVNPAGFDLRRRENAFGRDVNNISAPTLANPHFTESRIMAKALGDKHYAIYLALHEDIDHRGFYAYVHGRELHPIYARLIKKTAKRCPILKQKKIYGARSNEAGLIINSPHDKAFHDYLHYRGQTDISLTTETPGQLPLSTRIAVNLFNIKFLTHNFE